MDMQFARGDILKPTKNNFKTIVPIDTRTELQKAVDMLEKELIPRLKINQIQAKLAKSQYDELIKEGFTEQQAMQVLTIQPCWK